ncbi:hypothetical protein XELAEV_18027372mg [Xenopus laevis]|uniref:Uncharacterized protein n=1 Tax=Xenopus laevis TaxID=8355 RepID=A0A974CXZ2_XENLA|nr:hypothetical protein XELAEV_18027372mg [Xenopus laevis]
MDKFLGPTTNMASKGPKSKLKEKKQTLEITQPESDSETTSRMEDMVHVLGPLLDQKLADIKESVSEILQQLTTQSQRMSQAEDRISTLEDNLNTAQSTIDLQQKEISILSDKVERT